MAPERIWRIADLQWSEVLSVTDWLLALGMGLLMGVLSGFGVGGGTMLLIYLTTFVGLDQHTAQGINLLYYLPAALMALPNHVKNGYVEKDVLWPAVIGGLLCAGAGAWAATGLEVGRLRVLFGGFLVAIGLWELFGPE